MTLDEAIAHAREVAKRQRDAQIKYFGRLTCDSIEKLNKCEKEHEQLAEWLEELKELREVEDKFKRNINFFNEINVKVYNKAIDNFAERMKYEYGSDEIHETIDEIAEQLKAGEDNVRL